jgi:hypothetical protein
MATGNLNELQFAISKTIYNEFMTEPDWLIIKEAIDAGVHGPAWVEMGSDIAVSAAKGAIESLLLTAGAKAALVNWSDD